MAKIQKHKKAKLNLFISNGDFFELWKRMPYIQVLGIIATATLITQL